MPGDPVPAAALSRWLATATDVAVDGAPITLERLAGGHSNLTYRIVDAGGASWVLRRPPIGAVPSTAHDMAREWRFLTALAPTAVPVPRPVAYCADLGVLGAPFYVMGFVDGAVLDDAASGTLLDPAVRRPAAFALIDGLAVLHAVDPDAVGLADLRRPGSYVERQLHRWHERVHDTAVADLSVVDAAHARLRRWAATLPDAAVGIVHGDYRFGNVAIGPDGALRAVFDWELAALGDPRADVGWLLASWAHGGVEPIVAGPDLAGGFPSADELVARYTERAGVDPGELTGWVAFARWRVACIQAGVHARYRAGAMGTAEDATAARARLTAMTVQAQAALAAFS